MSARLTTAIEDKTKHRAATARISATSKRLYATTRGPMPPKDNKKRVDGGYGYVSAFNLNADGSIGDQTFIVKTTSGGGGSNQVLPATFDDDYFAILDSATGFVEMWKTAEDGKSAAPIAHLSIRDQTEGVGGCCSNAVWLQ